MRPQERGEEPQVCPGNVGDKRETFMVELFLFDDKLSTLHDEHKSIDTQQLIMTDRCYFLQYTHKKSSENVLFYYNFFKQYHD